MAEKTAAGLVAWCEENLGMPYIYGFFGQAPTKELLAMYAKMYPYSTYYPFYGPNDMPRYLAMIGNVKRAFDCSGLVKGYIWYDEKTGRPKYNGKQDVGADDMRKLSNPQPIDTLPEIPGVLVFMKRHVGVYIGGGKVIECRWGSVKRTVETRLQGRGWTTWGRHPSIQYPDTPAPEKPVEGPTEDVAGFQVGDRVLVKPETVEYYPGLRVPEWVPGKVYTVDQVRSKGARVIKGGKACVLLAELVTWCAVENLEKAQE